jgi:hypothetical protein
MRLYFQMEVLQGQRNDSISILDLWKQLSGYQAIEHIQIAKMGIERVMNDEDNIKIISNDK